MTDAEDFTYRGLGWDRPNEKPRDTDMKPAEFSTAASDRDIDTDMQPAKFSADFRVDLTSDPRDRSLAQRVNGE
jgi:hypothetical protein